MWGGGEGQGLGEDCFVCQCQGHCNTLPCPVWIVQFWFSWELDGVPEQGSQGSKSSPWLPAPH